MKIVKVSLHLLLISFSFSMLNAQNDLRATETPTDQVAKSTEFAIPASPAYQLLDASSTLVAQPTVVRDFKVDWSLRSYSISPNIAIEVQPVWEILYNKAHLTKYRKATPFMRSLSTLSLSAGTFQKDNAHSAALAAKVTLWRELDPLMDDEYYLGLEEEYLEMKKSLVTQIKGAKINYDTLKIGKAKKDARAQLKALNDQMQRTDPDQKQKLKDMRSEYIKNHWNAAQVELAVGRVFSFEQFSLDSLNLRGSGFGVWTNGSKGFGQNWLLTGTARYSDLETKKDTVTFQNKVLSGGFSMRYGSGRTNVFVETIAAFREKTALDPETPKPVYTIAYGGDFLLGNSVRLCFGLRTIYNDKMQFRNFVPVASINCMMR
ncbi:MAG: hypothetical protein RI894_917 [Bacteroidota bacterium]|jgi:hypothetical protein